MKLGAAVLALVLGASGLGAPAESAGDGAPVATLVADIETSAAGGRAAAAYGHVEWNGITYFGASDRGHGLELWRSDGTPAGTRFAAQTTDWRFEDRITDDYNSDGADRNAWR